MVTPVGLMMRLQTTKARKKLADVLSAIDRREELLGLVESYRRLKRDLGLMDFSDQIELGARLASEQPDVGALERSRFKVVLLDEYQDTSVAQAIMLSRLFSGPDPERGLGARGHAAEEKVLLDLAAPALFRPPAAARGGRRGRAARPQRELAPPHPRIHVRRRQRRADGPATHLVRDQGLPGDSVREAGREARGSR